MPKLVISLDGAVLKSVPLVKAHTTLGRRPYNDIVIDNLTVSGEHAVLHRVGSTVTIEDLDSTNGTYVNGQPVRRQVLEHDDIIRINKYKIRYLVSTRVAEDDAAAAAVAAPRPPANAGGPHEAWAGGNTEPAPLAGATVGAASIRVLTGPGAGNELPLQKVVTTLGKPSVAVAAVTRRQHGYVLTRVDGKVSCNGQPLGDTPLQLNDGDLFELGDARMQFVLD